MKKEFRPELGKQVCIKLHEWGILLVKSLVSRQPNLGLLMVSGLLLFSSLACGVIAFVENPEELADMNGRPYSAAQTDTPIPTLTVFLGYTTPVYAPTETPDIIDGPTDWTTRQPVPVPVTPTWDWWITPSPTSFIITPTPCCYATSTAEWITTTPIPITTTPLPLRTTTPELPMIGFTTPEPTTTPNYSIEQFYYDQDVYIGSGQSVVFNVQNHSTAPAPNGGTYHYVELLVKNESGRTVIVPLADLFFIREVRQGERVVNGRWGILNEPLLASNQPTIIGNIEATPIPEDETIQVTLGFLTPAGTVERMGMLTNWESFPVEGGLPVWFNFTPYPDPPYINAQNPPPPTSIVLDEGFGGDVAIGGTPPPAGIGEWPTSGSITRGFGCEPFYTGVDGAGYGCPPDRPWFHNGVDIANTEGSAVYAPIDGNLIWSGPNSSGPDCSHIAGSQAPHEGLGNFQKLSGGGYLMYFGHLSAFTQTSGDAPKGTQIAQMGSTGCSTGSHLHWICYQNGNLIDCQAWAGGNPPP